MKRSHSPTPWKAKIPKHTAPEIYSGKRLVARIPYWMGSEDVDLVRANAEFVERAVNTHYSMRNVLGFLSYSAGQCLLHDEKFWIDADTLKEIDEALAKARG